MQTGKVKMWDVLKGYGFIVTDEGDELFANVRDFHPSLKQATLREGQKVKFDIRSDIKGDKAVNIRLDR